MQDRDVPVREQHKRAWSPAQPEFFWRACCRYHGTVCTRFSVHPLLLWWFRDEWSVSLTLPCRQRRFLRRCTDTDRLQWHRPWTWFLQYGNRLHALPHRWSHDPWGQLPVHRPPSKPCSRCIPEDCGSPLQRYRKYSLRYAVQRTAQVSDGVHRIHMP